MQQVRKKWPPMPWLRCQIEMDHARHARFWFSLYDIPESESTSAFYPHDDCRGRTMATPRLFRDDARNEYTILSKSPPAIPKCACKAYQFDNVLLLYDSNFLLHADVKLEKRNLLKSILDESVLSRMLTTLDDDTNGFRHILIPMAMSSVAPVSAKALIYAMLALSACHNQDLQRAWEHKVKAIASLARSWNETGYAAQLTKMAASMMLCVYEVSFNQYN